jgi:hypothetical protein
LAKFSDKLAYLLGEMGEIALRSETLTARWR